MRGGLGSLLGNKVLVSNGGQKNPRRLIHKRRPQHGVMIAVHLEDDERLHTVRLVGRCQRVATLSVTGADEYHVALHLRDPAPRRQVPDLV